MSGSHSGLHNLKRKKNLLGLHLHHTRRALENSRQAGQFPTACLVSSIARLKMEYRAMHLADCFMRGRAYSVCEQTRNSEPIWALVEHYIRQHGGSIVPMPRLEEWRRTNA